jgi:predicted nucleic acid-binding protein
MATLVIDASVAVKWIVSETNSQRASTLLTSGDLLSAPSVIQLEVGAALSRHVRTGALNATQARSDLAGLKRFFSGIIPSSVLVDAAFELSLQTRHPLYDCIYLALAVRESTVVVTADAKFVKKLAGTPYANSVVLLSDWTPS